jgi:ATP-binding cassette subfamily B protein
VAKATRPMYSKGIKKHMLLFVLCLIALEGLSLYFPILLQNVTSVAEDQFDGGGVLPLVWQGLLVLGFIILLFGVNFLTEYIGAVYTDKYQANIREKLYEKFSRLSSDQIDQIGAARIMPALMNDPSWLKLYHRRLVNLWVYFPVAILGSFIMLFTLNWIYALFAFASIPFVMVFSWICIRRMTTFIPASVDAFDEYFFNIKEGIRGARDIRILGKADERSADFEHYVTLNSRQSLATDRALALSTGFNAILFTIITIAIIVYGAAMNLTPGEMSGIVVLNTAIQYINKVWTGSHQIFTWFIDYLPRCRFTYKRLDKFYAMPDQPQAGGLKQIPVYENNHMHVGGVSLKRPSGKIELDNINIEIPDGKTVAIAGGISSGKSALANMLLKMDTPTQGAIAFNEIDIQQINTSMWRREIISYCATLPKFIPGTVRDNFRLLAPGVTDEQIMDAFHDIGADDFVEKFTSLLDFNITENANLSLGTKHIFAIVRCILKPAQIYVFNQCFEHVKHSYIVRLMAKMKREKKTAVLISYNASVCKHCDQIYVLNSGKISGSGTHAELMKTNKDYRELHSSAFGVLVYDDKKIEQKGETEAAV